MTSATICPECGAALTNDARRGVCPRCAVRMALMPGSDDYSESGAGGQSIRLLMADGTAAAPSLQGFGDYELIEEIGHGGMGVIFKARQRSLDRIVALKLIRAGSLARKGDITRFQTEAAAAARLKHPHIVTVYEVGEEEGRHFYSMEFVPGKSLAHRLLEGPLRPREAAQTLQAVAGAIQCAHQSGVLHRDLKPSNILLDAEGEPRVADFGLAKILHSDSELTVTGAVIGSPQYMPPEQARGSSAKAGPASDVYSLGAILYEVLTGRPPFQAPTPLETIKLVVSQEPIAPRALNPALPLDIETICLKCLAKDPAGRYATAQALADELDLFLRDQPIRARRVTTLERAWRWCRRKPALAVLAAVLTLAPLIIITILLVMRHQVTNERNRTAAQLYVSDIGLASRAIESQDYATAWRSLSAYLPETGRSPGLVQPPGFEWRWLWHNAQGQARKTLPAHFSLVSSVCYSGDGRLVASAGWDGKNKLWDASTGDLLREFVDPGSTDPVSVFSIQLDDMSRTRMFGVSFNSDGNRLLTSQGTDPGLALWDVESGRKLWGLVTNGLTIGFCSPTDPHLALAIVSYPRTNMGLIDLQAGKPIAFFSEGRTDTACFSPDSRQFARWDRDTRRTTIHDVPGGKLVNQIEDGRAYVISMAFTADGRTLVLGNMVKDSLDLFDVASGRQIGQLQDGYGRLSVLAVSPDGRWLASGGNDEIIRIWDLALKTLVCKLTGHRGEITALVFSPDSRSLASGGRDGTVRFWDVAPPAPPPPITNVFGAFAFSQDGGQLLTQGTNQTLRLWQLPEQRLVREFFAPGFQSAVYTASNKWLLACINSLNEPFCLALPPASDSSPSDGARAQAVPARVAVSLSDCVPLRGISSPCSAITLLADGKLAVTGHRDGTVAFWDAVSGRLRRRVSVPPTDRGAPASVDSLVISSDGKTLVATCFKPVLMSSWNVDGGKPLKRRYFTGFYQMPLAVSPDGERIATSGMGQGFDINIWNRNLDHREMILSGHLDVPQDIQFSPDGRTLASCDIEGSVKLWNLPTQREALTTRILGKGVWPNRLAFSADGVWLGAADTHGVLHLFYGPPPSPDKMASWH